MIILSLRCTRPRDMHNFWHSQTMTLFVIFNSTFVKENLSLLSFSWPINLNEVSQSLWFGPWNNHYSIILKFHSQNNITYNKSSNGILRADTSSTATIRKNACILVPNTKKRSAERFWNQIVLHSNQILAQKNFRAKNLWRRWKLTFTLYWKLLNIISFVNSSLFIHNCWDNWWDKVYDSLK